MSSIFFSQLYTDTWPKTALANRKKEHCLNPCRLTISAWANMCRTLYWYIGRIERATVNALIIAPFLINPQNSVFKSARLLDPSHWINKEELLSLKCNL